MKDIQYTLLSMDFQIVTLKSKNITNFLWGASLIVVHWVTRFSLSNQIIYLLLLNDNIENEPVAIPQSSLHWIVG